MKMVDLLHIFEYKFDSKPSAAPIYENTFENNFL